MLNTSNAPNTIYLPISYSAKYCAFCSVIAGSANGGEANPRINIVNLNSLIITPTTNNITGLYWFTIGY